MAYNVQPFAIGSFPNLLGGDTDDTGVATPNTPELAATAPWAPPSANVTASRKGVYAEYPASTPKYSTSNDDRSLQTQARLLIPMPDKLYKKYLASFVGEETRALAEAITAPSGKDRADLPNGYIDFLLTQAREGFEEKVQIVDVVGDNYVAYFFGQRPPIFSYEGVLMNTMQDDWRLAMLLLYQNVIRGTQLARRNTMVTLAYDNLAVTGALVGMDQSLTAEMQMAAQFSFQILVKRLDVRRTRGAMPTVVGALPYAVQPDLFATTQVFGVPPAATMRETGKPTNATEERTAPAANSDMYNVPVPVSEPNVLGARPVQGTKFPSPKVIIRSARTFDLNFIE